MGRRTPNLIDQFTDYRRFVIEALKKRGQSRKELAEALGPSDSMMSQVLSKKRRLRASLVPTLADFFGMSEDERHMLAALVDLDNESAFARRTAWAAVQARQRYLAEDKPSEEVFLQAFTHWYVPAIYELAGCEGFQADPTWIATVLNPRITVEQAEDALQTLLKAGLLRPSDGGALEPVPQEVWADGRIPAGAMSDLIAGLQKVNPEHAERSYSEFLSSERHSGGVTFAVSEARYEQVLQRLRVLERELVVLTVEDDEQPPNRVFQLCINLFPMSDYTDD